MAELGIGEEFQHNAWLGVRTQHRLPRGVLCLLARPLRLDIYVHVRLRDEARY